MICDHCHKHEACVFIQEHGPNGQHSLNLCQKCAMQQFLGTQGGHLRNFLGNISKLLANMDNPSIDKLLSSLPDAAAETPSCPHCGRRQLELEDTWELGCAECATTFRISIDRRWHENGLVWPLPDARPQPLAPPADKKKEIARLSAELRQAVRREDYERAAFLRDQLQSLAAEDEG